MAKQGNRLTDIERERSLIRRAARDRLPQLSDAVLSRMDEDGTDADMDAAMREFYAIRLAEFHASLPEPEGCNVEFPAYHRAIRRGRA